MLMHCKRDASHTMTYSYGGTGHVWDEGTITTQPTYDEYGVRTLHCKNCDATTTEKVLPTKYTFTVTPADLHRGRLHDAQVQPR